ncbi:aldo/keto reductase [Haloarcula marina]|uniref:aldo/keto reductase n=1 Tax=Haloarcula marina TaxID=2961574 RepID=UPI0020B749D0|nr:aldo/keto reductase [Halomicroarcula marina]
MEYTYLGDTGLEVSRLCLGCMNFGSGNRPGYEWDWTTDDEEKSLEVIERAIDLGINFFDTANMYSTGESEEILGKALEGRRDEFVVATKVYNQMAQRPNGMGLSRKHIMEQIDASLERLGTDYVDLYQIHRWDEHTPIEETLRTLDTLVDQGKVRYVGASSMTGWRFMKALKTSDVEHYERFVSMQPEYSLVNRHEEANVLPVCADQDIGVVPWSPLARGFLAGKYERDATIDADSKRFTEDRRPEDRFSDDAWETLNRVREIAAEKDATPAQVSLAWLLHKDVVDAPIIGPRKLDHLEDNVGALTVSLTDNEVSHLEAPIDPTWSPEDL